MQISPATWSAARATSEAARLVWCDAIEAAAKVCEALADDSMKKAARMGLARREEAWEVAKVERDMGGACADEIRKLARPDRTRSE